MDVDPVIVIAPEGIEYHGNSTIYFNDETKFQGDLVNTGETLCELEMEKCCIQIESPIRGVVTDIFVQDETEIQEGIPLYELTEINSNEDTIRAAMKILAKRFPDSTSQFQKVLEKVDNENLLACLPVIGRGTPQEIIMTLANG